MILNNALTIANRLLADLQPHCHSIQIAGSIRRAAQLVKDIELVAIPHSQPCDSTDLFGLTTTTFSNSTGFCNTVRSFGKIIKGSPSGKYCQLELPDNIKLDLFLANHHNWGYILALRTGPAAFSQFIVSRAKKLGYLPVNGNLYCRKTLVPIPSEDTLFQILHLKTIPPNQR